MISSPRPGQRVRIHYAAAYAPCMPWHGRDALVVISGRGRPRNHLVDVSGHRIVVPCGNLVEVKEL
jgi:hypothetical protein